MKSMERVQILRELGLLDTAPEPEFDDFVELATNICEAPIGLVSLLDEDRQWFKARIGFPLQQTPLEDSFCQYAVETELLVVEDAREDVRFQQNRYVLQEGGPRFYAGVPITAKQGVPVGTLCVLDVRPRVLSAMQISALRMLGRQVSARLELRTRRREMERTLAEAEEMKRRLALNEQMFRSFMDNGPFYSFLKRPNGTFLYQNERLAEHFGIPQAELLKKRDVDLWPADFVASARKHDAEVLRSGQICIQENTVLNRRNEQRYWRTYKFPCGTVQDQMVIAGISFDVTTEMEQTRELEKSRRELETANQRLQTLAETDPLTALPNRRAFDERLRSEWARASQEGHALSLAFMDIDYFKRRNDTYGHAAGDLVLQHLARVMKAEIRESDLFARYGGEEFALLLPETTEEKAELIVTRLLAAIHRTEWKHEPVTASFGTASRTEECYRPEDLVRCADDALYAAKHAGRDRAVLYSVHAGSLAQPEMEVGLCPS